MSIARISAWSMWFVVSLFYAYQYILRVMPSIMMNDIMHQYAINATTFGQFSGVYYIGYSLMHIPLGILLDKYGPKKILPLCMALTSIGLLPILFTSVWIYPIMGRIMIGMCSSAAILGTFKVIRLTFSESKFTRMLSFSVIIGLTGAIYGGGPVSYMCTVFGYHAVVTLFAAIGLGLAIITYFIMPTIDAPHADSMLTNMREVFLSPTVIGICIFSGLLVGPLEGFADVWASVFLKQVYGFSSVVAASLPSVMFFGMGFGGPLLSLIAEKTKSYLAIIAVSGLIMMISFIALVMGFIPLQAMGVVFVIVGVCSAYQIIAIFKASTYVREQVTGLATAVANMIIMIFGYFFHSSIGLIVNKMGGIDNAQALVAGVSVIPIALAIGSIGFIAIAMYDRVTKKE